MSDSEHSDVSWEEFFGTTTDLMPTLLGMYDALFDTNKNFSDKIQPKPVVSVKKSNQFSNLSPTVQKMLANISDQNENDENPYTVTEDVSTKSQSRRTSKYFDTKCSYTHNRTQKTQYAEQRNSLALNYHLNKSSECLATICDNATSNVQKMLSNIPDQDLIICTDSVKKLNNTNEMLSDSNKCNYSQSFTHKRNAKTDGHKLQRGKSDVNSSFLYKVCNRSISDANNMCEIEITSVSDSVSVTNCSFNSSQEFSEEKQCSKQKITPLSPKMNSKRNNYLQVSDVSSQQNEKEVSRPVSLSSLGSCSSSGSSGPNQPSSMYLASTESLDSDPEPTGSQGSADSGIAENPVMSPEQRVLQEILDTENVYVTDLKQVVEGYLQFWRMTSDCPLNENLSDLFSNIEEIYEFNRKFLDELYESGNDLTFVANAFIQNDSGFRIYTEYCTHYPRIMAVLTELTQDMNKAQLIRERQMALGHALPLGSYLLKPVQRILKYHLLLQRLTKLCEPSQQPSVDMALTTMTSIAGHINHMKGKHEHAVRVQEIQAQLYGWTGADLTAMGELCAEGAFRVGGARGYRHVFLFDKVLLITKNKSDGVLAYKSHIMCSNLMLVESVRGEPLSFHVIPFDNPRLQVTLRAKSLEHKREWTLQLKRVILENYNAVIPSHARQLVMQLGQEVNVTDDISTVDKWTPLKQYSAPEYLERRSRVRKSRDHSDRRAASHDRAFASLAAWRRKSEPNVAHYNTKTLPKKISKMKKAKDKGAKFYTDLSDSETCDVISESNDSLIEPKSQEGESSEATLASNTLEQVVSQLLMQNQEFQKILNRQRKLVKDEHSGVWLKQNVSEKPKSDSLPRSFQLNEDVNIKEPEKKPEIEEKLEESDVVDTSTEVNDEEDEEMYPDHKIYRKSTIRFSLVQRFRAMISEESQRVNKLPTYKQGSELMGAKIAQPDYADPQKLFSTVSQTSLDTESVGNDSQIYEEIRTEVSNSSSFSNSSSISSRSDQIDTGQSVLSSTALSRSTSLQDATGSVGSKVFSSTQNAVTTTLKNARDAIKSPLLARRFSRDSASILNSSQGSSAQKGIRVFPAFFSGANFAKNRLPTDCSVDHPAENHSEGNPSGNSSENRPSVNDSTGDRLTRDFQGSGPSKQRLPADDSAGSRLTKDCNKEIPSRNRFLMDCLTTDQHAANSSRNCLQTKSSEDCLTRDNHTLRNRLPLSCSTGNHLTTDLSRNRLPADCPNGDGLTVDHHSTNPNPSTNGLPLDSPIGDRFSNHQASIPSRSSLPANISTEDNPVDLPAEETHGIPACSDSYYEKLLERDLHNEDTSANRHLNSTSPTETIKNNKNSQEAQNSEAPGVFLENVTSCRTRMVEAPPNPPVKPSAQTLKCVKRPIKPPPPVPAKPARLSIAGTAIGANNPKVDIPSTKGWVKTVVGRFE